MGKIEKIIDYPLGQSASDPSMILDKQTNTIFVYNYMDLDNQKDIYYLKYISSNDNGKSWSKQSISQIKFQKKIGKMILNLLHQGENSNKKRYTSSLFS